MASVWPDSVILLGSRFSAGASSRRMARMCGTTRALASSNIGRFSVSTICRRRPSVVMSIRICERNCWNTGLLAMSSSSCFFISARRLASASSSLVLSVFLTSPSTCIGSAPPPEIMLELRLALSPPFIATRSGMRKCSAMPSRCFGLEMDSSHITRKNAIMAVMKSAYAIFQPPPWWPPPCALCTCLMMILGLPSLMVALSFARWLGYRVGRRVSAP